MTDTPLPKETAEAIDRYVNSIPASTGVLREAYREIATKGAELALASQSAFAAGQEVMREAAAQELEELEAFCTDKDGVFDERYRQEVEIALSLAQSIRALPIQPAPSPWRPISEAPKDGTRIIGAFWSISWADDHRKGDVVTCWWQPEFEAFISYCLEMTLAGGYSFEDGSNRKLHSPKIEPVTHWMPLPSPPEAV